MTGAAFLAFTLAVAALLVATAAWQLGQRAALRLALGLSAWLGYVTALSLGGVIADPARRPPGFLFIAVPVVLFMVLGVARSAAAGRLAARLPLALLIGFQSYRIGVELFLHRLWQDGIVPKALTFAGANFDIAIGLSAPLLAALAVMGCLPRRVALLWNIAGLAMLANVVARSVASAPGPLHAASADVPNLMPGLFPYSFLPGFLAPLAVALHILSLRHLRASRG